MAKQVLKTLDLTTLLVALDHLEEHGPPAAVPDPYTHPAECAYLKNIGEEHAAAIAARVPHVRVAFKVPGGRGHSRQVRTVFGKAAIVHVLKFSFPNEQDFAPFVRDLATVGSQYWKVLDSNGEPIPRPKPRQGVTPPKREAQT